MVDNEHITPACSTLPGGPANGCRPADSAARPAGTARRAARRGEL